jgi:hypothetical protein
MKRILGLAFVILCGCSSSNSGSGPAASARVWQCYENYSSANCDCHAVSPGETVFSSGFRVPHCIDYSCCIIAETSNPSDANCICNGAAAATCDAEAASRPGSKVVSQCPPLAEDVNVGACAAQGVNCGTVYLSQNNLDGCCAGTVCTMAATGVPTCQAATAAEIAHALECKQDSRATATNSLTIANPTLVTSVGTLTFDGVDTLYAVSATLGPMGCVSELSVTLKGASTCRFGLTAGVVAGKLAATEVSASFADCAGYTGTSSFSSVLAMNPPGIDLTVTGDPCYVGDGFVLPGTFDFHIGNTTISGVTFSDQHLVFNGYVQGFTSTAACPTP